MFQQNASKFVILMFLFLIVIMGCHGSQLSEQQKASVVTYVHPLLEIPTGLLAGRFDEITNMSGVAVMNQIYETLFTYDDYGNIKPLLVDKWFISKDGLKYIVYLKKGVLFHNEVELTSKDVVYSLKRAVSKCKEFQQLLINNDLGQTVNSCGTYCVQIQIARPYPMLLSLFTGGIFKIFPDNFVKLGQVPVGTGPFMLYEKEGGDFWAKRFTRYHDGSKSNIDAIVFRHLSKGKAIEAFKKHEVDDLFEYILSEEEAKNLSGKIITHPTFIFNYIGMNTKLNPFNNRKVRLAVQYAIDKDKLFDKYFSQHLKIYGIIPRGISGGNRAESLFGFSPEKARRILKETNIKLPLKVNFWVRNQDWNEEFINDVVQQLADVGIIATKQQVANNVFYEKYFSRKQQLFFITMGLIYPESSYSLNVFHSDNIDNDISLTNHVIDSELKRLSYESDSVVRKKLADKIERLILEEGAIIPIYQRRALTVHQNDVEGIKPSYLWYNQFVVNSINKGRT